MVECIRLAFSRGRRNTGEFGVCSSFWWALHSAENAGMSIRYFLLITCAFNLFTGTGYFFFSGVTNFGDWAAVISGLYPHWLWRALLVVGGAANLLRGCPRRANRARALRGSSAGPAKAIAKVDHHAVCLGYSAVGRCRRAKSARNTTIVAIGPACDRWRSKRVAVV